MPNEQYASDTVQCFFFSGEPVARKREEFAFCHSTREYTCVSCFFLLRTVDLLLIGFSLFMLYLCLPHPIKEKHKGVFAAARDTPVVN